MGFLGVHCPVVAAANDGAALLPPCAGVFEQEQAHTSCA